MNLGVHAKLMVYLILNSKTSWKTTFKYILSTVLKIYTQEQVKINQPKNLSSNTTPRNTSQYSVSSVGSLTTWLKGLQKIDLPSCSEVREIDNPDKHSLCESVCVLKIVHFVN